LLILDIADRLDEFDRDAFIFAERLDGVFKPFSRATVLSLSDSEHQEPVSEVAARRAPGLEYCLEIELARDSVEVWSRWRTNKRPSPMDAAEAICHKATHDAWGPPVEL